MKVDLINEVFSRVLIPLECYSGKNNFSKPLRGQMYLSTLKYVDPWQEILPGKEERIEGEREGTRAAD
jgi:hypothetical protein